MATTDPAAALQRLRDAAARGDVEALAAHHGIGLLVAFGSAARGEPQPRDLDIAFAPGRDTDVLALLADLVALAGTDRLDLLDLDRAGVVARMRALSRCVPLHEDRPGRFAAEQLRAAVVFADTRWLRDEQLRALAS